MIENRYYFNYTYPGTGISSTHLTIVERDYGIPYGD